MSVSKDYIVPDLYCNESAEDVVHSSDANISVQHFHENLDLSSDEESSIDVAFDSEVDQFLDYSELKRRFCSSSGSVTSRIEVVNWMLKVVDSWKCKLSFSVFLVFLSIPFDVFFSFLIRSILTTILGLKLHISLSTIWIVSFCLIACQ